MLTRSVLCLLPLTLLACAADAGPLPAPSEAPVVAAAPDGGDPAARVPTPAPAAAHSATPPSPPPPPPATVASCGAWGDVPPAPAGMTLGPVREVQRVATLGTEYVLALQYQKASMVGPAQHRLLLQRVCTGAACACAGTLHVRDVGWNPSASLVVSRSKAAIYVRDPRLNGGGSELLLRVDLAGAVATTPLELGASRTAECRTAFGAAGFGFVTAAATNDGADLELVGMGCAPGQTGEGAHVGLLYAGFFRDVALADDLAERAWRF